MFLFGTLFFRFFIYQQFFILVSVYSQGKVKQLCTKVQRLIYYINTKVECSADFLHVFSLYSNLVWAQTILLRSKCHPSNRFKVFVIPFYRSEFTSDVPNSVAKMINWGYASDMTDQKFFPYQAMTDAPLTPLPAPRLALTAWAAALTQWPHTVICSSTEVPRHNLLNPTPISKSAPHHLCHHHLLITTRSAARDLLSDMATRRVFHLDSPTHVFQP